MEVWGTGSPRREFMYSEDMADACVFLMKNYNGNEIVNIGTGEDITIRELTKMVAEVVDYKGEIRWDITKPDGMPQKLLDVSFLHSMGWKHRTPFEEALRLTYKDFLQQMSINKPDPGTFLEKPNKPDQPKKLKNPEKPNKLNKLKKPDNPEQ